MSVLTVTTVLILLFSIVTKRGIAGALALGGATPAGACVAAGAIVIPTFYGVGLVALGVVVLHALLRRPDMPRPERWVPGLPLLVALLVYGALITLVAPYFFNGMPIVTPQAKQLVVGLLTTSNIAQIVYLTVGVGVVAYLGRSRGADVGVLGLAVGASVYLSAWKYASTNFGLPFPEGVFDNSPNFQFIQTSAGGTERFRGIFSEPSALGASCLVAVLYFLARTPRLRTGGRVFAVITVAVAVFLGLQSTSTTFVLAGVIVAALAVLTVLFSFISRRSALSALGGLGICVLLIVAVYVIPIVVTFANATVAEKLGGDSFSERSGSDGDSLQVFLNSWGLGVGLGAGRGSSLLPSMLSTVGLVGTLCFAAAVVLLIRRAAPSAEFRPVIWALVALLTAKLVAGADLADPTGLLWLCLGLLAWHAVAEQRWPNLEVRRGAVPVLAGRGR